jgi:hypothetical protein
MDITSSNSQYVLNVPGVFPVPQLLQGYATDDAFSTEEVDVAEVFMGVDGFMSSANIPFIIKQSIVLQADSPSIPNTFLQWLAANIAARQNFLANGTILLPSIGTQYALTNGVLLRTTPVPHAKKSLQPLTFQIAWNTVAAQPYNGL